MIKLEIQYGGKNTVTSEVENRVKKELKDNDIKLNTIVNVDIYYKPEENEIYYVATTKDGRTYRNIQAIRL